METHGGVASDPMIPFWFREIGKPHICLHVEVRHMSTRKAPVRGGPILSVTLEGVATYTSCAPLEAVTVSVTNSFGNSR